MSSTDIEPSEITKWDPVLTERVMGLLKPFLKGWHRAEVRGLDTSPRAARWWWPTTPAACSPMDVPVFASGFYKEFGFDRPVYTLEPRHVVVGPTGDFFKKTGFIPANHKNADEALRSGGVVVVFPGGDYDVYRPTRRANKIDFDGRTGYVKAALNAGVPIVPDGGDRRPGEPAVPLPGRLRWPRRSASIAGCSAPRSSRCRSASRSACRSFSRSTCPLPTKIAP